MPTKALYLNDTYLFQSSAHVEAVEHDEQGTAIILDQTIFYPQGGGQPTDMGMITSVSAEFQVLKVLCRPDGAVAHYGSFLKGELRTGDEVALLIDENRRILNARNHTAGHLLAFAAERIYPQLVGVKGYHFPDGPYVEFEGLLNETDKTEASMVLEKAVQSMIEQKLPVTVRLVDADELSSLCRHILPNMPMDKPTRAMIVNDVAFGCGGTHLTNTKDVGSFKVRKIKMEKGRLKISYAIA